MEPLAFIAAFLGVGGLGAILKIVLGYAARSQRLFSEDLARQREDFETFLTNRLEGLGYRLEEQTRVLNLLVRKLEFNASRTRESHRKLAHELRSKRGGVAVADAMEKIFDDAVNGKGEK